MNIIEVVKSILQEFPKISEVCNKMPLRSMTSSQGDADNVSGGLHVDFTDSEPTSYGLSSTGDTLLSEDVLGNQTRQHSFVLYAVYQSMNDYDRMNNSGVLLELQMWLEKYAENNMTVVETDGTELTGALTKLTCANGMLYAIPNGNEADGWQYQLQIIAEYKINI